MILSPPGTGMLGAAQGLGQGENPEVNGARRKPQYGSARSEEEAPGATAAEPEARGDGWAASSQKCPGRLLCSQAVCTCRGAPALPQPSFSEGPPLWALPHRVMVGSQSHPETGPEQCSCLTAAGKEPRPQPGAVSITLMWASTIQTWANIVLM